MKNTNKKRASSSTGKRAQDAVHQTNLTAEERQKIERMKRSRQQMGQRVPIELEDLSPLLIHGPFYTWEDMIQIFSVLLEKGIYPQDLNSGSRTPGEGRNTGGGGGGSGDQNRIIDSVPFWKRFWKTLFSLILALVTALPTIITLYERYLTN